MASEDFEYRDAEINHATRYLLGAVQEELAELSQDATVLDLGCGNGAFTAAFSRPGWRVFGVDASESGIRIARERFPSIIFQQGSIDSSLAASLGVAGFDAIVCAEVVEHMYYPRELVRVAFGLLRPGGKLVLTTPYHGYLKNCALALSGKMDKHWTALSDGGHIKFWSWETIRTLIQEAGFINYSFRGAGRVPFLWKGMVISSEKPLRSI